MKKHPCSGPATAYFVVMAMPLACDLNVVEHGREVLNGQNAPEHWMCEPEDAPTADDDDPSNNHPNCPEIRDFDVVNGGLACALPRGGTCAYRDEGSFTVCVCGCASSQVWSCHSFSEEPGCPTEQPPDGSSCMGSAECHYLPQTNCECDGDAWSCGIGAWEDPAQTPDDQTCFGGTWTPTTEPSGVAACTPVNQLTTEEATAWCSWYATNFWPETNEAPPDEFRVEDGFVLGGGSRSCGHGGSPACVQHLNVEYCVANLAHGNCPLALGQVEDCVRTMIDECRVIEDGCGPLLSLAECHETIVQIGREPPRCTVPID